jgi:hypothetical protein
MKTSAIALLAFFLIISGLFLPSGNAIAELKMQEREHVQMVVLLVEFAAFVAALVIGWIVWRISKRDSENKKSGHKNSR